MDNDKMHLFYTRARKRKYEIGMKFAGYLHDAEIDFPFRDKDYLNYSESRVTSSQSTVLSVNTWLQC